MLQKSTALPFNFSAANLYYFQNSLATLNTFFELRTKFTSY
jgi:hypothetical protein